MTLLRFYLFSFCCIYAVKHWPFGFYCKCVLRFNCSFPNTGKCIAIVATVQYKCKKYWRLLLRRQVTIALCSRTLFVHVNQLFSTNAMRKNYWRFSHFSRQKTSLVFQNSACPLPALFLLVPHHLLYELLWPQEPPMANKYRH